MLRLSPSHLILLVVAVIWGGGFVAQKSGLDNLGPYSFNTARFILATLSLVPVWFYMRRGLLSEERSNDRRCFWVGGVVAGVLLTAGLSMQQVGLQYTTAGNAGFITGMYIVIVPVLGLLFFKQKTRWVTWAGIVLAVLGLYQLSVAPGSSIFSMNYGDGLQLIGALFWALHVLTLGWLARRVNDLVGLSAVQFAVCAVASYILMLSFEEQVVQWDDFSAELVPLLYSGVMASGVAFTLQIIGQRGVASEIAALILSFEAVFALLTGILFLGESFGARELVGCGLMMSGILLTLWPEKQMR
uniref:Permease of the drug/metabolite transporter (DMT) superfamily n=1 Tax=uncultured Thiotrichaceae bacterium TaxID=298394 RepID=A0A6S6UKH7_9GAMM|nr:MAG: Permease of the drug/metabolite transporter (DMT) superfamily [uncultured Thiotrichaceae bacterium]